jgi:hypothetical protein
VHAQKSGAVRRATITIKKGKKTVLKKSLKPTSKGVLSIKPKRKLKKGTTRSPSSSATRPARSGR